MKRSVKALLLIAILIATMSSSAQVLTSFRWEYRVLVVFARADQIGNIQAQLESIEAGVLDRHMRWFVVGGDSTLTNYDEPLPADFSKQLTQLLRNNQKADLEVVLVGKDGGVKYRSAKLELDTIFKTIDNMPMRQAEMHQ